MAQLTAPTISHGHFEKRAGLLSQIGMVTRRNLTVILRTPQALLPPLIISVFFLVIYESTLGEAAGFLPRLILPHAGISDLVIFELSAERP